RRCRLEERGGDEGLVPQGDVVVRDARLGKGGREGFAQPPRVADGSVAPLGPLSKVRRILHPLGEAVDERADLRLSLRPGVGAEDRRRGGTQKVMDWVPERRREPGPRGRLLLVIG